MSMELVVNNKTPKADEEKIGMLLSALESSVLFATSTLEYIEYNYSEDIDKKTSENLFLALDCVFHLLDELRA